MKYMTTGRQIVVEVSTGYVLLFPYSSLGADEEPVNRPFAVSNLQIRHHAA